MFDFIFATLCFSGLAYCAFWIWQDKRNFKKLKERGFAVIRSCNTAEQFEAAENYCRKIARLDTGFMQYHWHMRDFREVIDARREMLKLPLRKSLH